MPRISIPISVYNGIPYICEAVDSVFAQNIEDWELLISDNGSTDDTLAFLDTLKDARIRIHRQTENLGAYGNLNFLIAQTSTTISKILCADDALLPDSLERILTFMEMRPGCAISRCWSQGDGQLYEPGGPWHVESSLPTRLEPAAAVLAFATLGNMVGNLSRAACRPAMVIAAGGFDCQFPYAGDYEGWLRVVGRFGIDLQNEELVYVRVHKMQGSNLLNKKNEAFPQIDSILNKLASQVTPDDLTLLLKHWAINFFSPRVPRFARQLMAGKLRLAFSIWQDLPLGISPWLCIAAYPAWKAKLPWAQATTRELIRRIIQLNERDSAAAKARGP